jgi:hypothetical protein
MSAAMDQALLGIADAVYLVGQYARLFDVPVQVYTRADMSSFLPTE